MLYGLLLRKTFQNKYTYEKADLLLSIDIYMLNRALLSDYSLKTLSKILSYFFLKVQVWDK